MRFSRKALFGTAAGVVAGVAVLRYPGDAAEFTYKLSTDQPTTNPIAGQSIEAAKRVLDASHGQIDIKVFPNGELGDQTQVISQLRLGAIELLLISSHILADVVPVAALETIPFAFNTPPEVMNVANGPLGAYIATASLKAGIRKLHGAWYGGTFQTQNRLRPIETPADLKGLKIRVPPAPVDVAIFKAFGASPTVLPSSQVYVSLQTHLVDGIEVPLPTVENFKYYEQVKYVSMTNHAPLSYSMLANTAVWDRLPKPLQQLVEREFNASATTATVSMMDGETKVETTLRSQGLVFNRPALEPFRQIVRSAGLYAQWRDAYDPEGWKILEKSAGRLT